MDFGRVLDEIAGFLDGRERPWALIGGLGLAAFGMERFTLDLDLVVPGAEQDEIVTFMDQLGYELLHRSRAFSSHVHARSEMGRVDFMYVYGDTAERVFEARRFAEGASGRPVPVASPEHLAAMKVQAMAEDPTRRFQDLADVQFLLRLPGIDRAKVRETFTKRGLERLYDDLEKTL